MSNAQITAILNEVGAVSDAWTSLEGNLTHINLQCDSILCIDPKRIQWYFDSTNELLFIRYTCGKPKKLSNGAAIPDGYVSVSHKGNPYLLRLENGGANDATIGRFHEALSYDIIVGLINKKR